MRRLDRYIFRQIVGPFLFFVMVFTGIIWLTQSLRVIDTVVNNGQSARVFLEFTALLLPMVLSIVLPISAFAAVLYAVNRLLSDSEIVVMLASGLSGLSMVRAVTVFSIMVMAVTFCITLYLMPTSQREMRDRIFQIKGDVAAALLRAGEFLEPVPGVTIYVREIGRPGELFGVFVQDERNPEQIVTYNAERAAMIRDGVDSRLVLLDGVALGEKPNAETELLILRFDQLGYDLSHLSSGDRARARKPSEMFVDRLLTITEEEGRPRPLGDYRAEGHEALTAPLYVLVMPLLGVAILMAGGFRRQGFAARIVIAGVGALALRLAGLAAKGAVSGAAWAWPALYVPPLFGLLIAIAMLSGMRFAWPARRAVRAEAS